MERSAAACGGHGVLSQRMPQLSTLVAYSHQFNVKYQRGQSHHNLHSCNRRNYSGSNSELICLAQEIKTKGEERAWKRGRRRTKKANGGIFRCNLIKKEMER